MSKGLLPSFRGAKMRVAFRGETHEVDDPKWLREAAHVARMQQKKALRRQQLDAKTSATKLQEAALVFLRQSLGYVAPSSRRAEARATAAKPYQEKLIVVLDGEQLHVRNWDDLRKVVKARGKS